jgi:galactarate dehydratase
MTGTVIVGRFGYAEEFRQDTAVKPISIRVHPADNVAVVVNPEGLPAGSELSGGLRLAEAVPMSHKVALSKLSRGDAIIRYGEVIGRAAGQIPAGGWVREELVELPPAPALDDLPLATAVPPDLEPLEGYTFEGYAHPDGSAGTKNILGVTTTVQCVAPTVEHAAERIRRELLPRFPNVDGIVAITHAYGCGVAINAPDAPIPIRSIRNLSRNPNFGGDPLVVSLGCEKMQPDRLFPTEALAAGSAPPQVLRLQEQQGFQASVSAILEFAEKRLEELNRRQRTTRPAADLVVGLQCGGSDAFSGVTANPAVGYAADLLVRAGATVMFSEVTEVRDAVHLLTPRCVSEEVGRALIREMRWYDDYLARGEADRSANPSPGNKKGGLSNVVEKALGSVAKAGTTPLRGVLTHGERASTKGLLFAATPASDFVCGTQQLASGMNIHVFTTGRGTPYGLALCPVVKVSTNSSLAERWPDLIDVDAGPIATGEKTIEDVGWELFRFILETASGRKKTWTEQWGLANALTPFNPGPVT